MTSIALRTAVTDPALRSYVQQYPFLTGPNELANARALSALRTGIRISRWQDDGEVHRQPNEVLSLTQAQNTAACDMLRAPGAGGMKAIQDFSGFFDETTLVICGDAIIDLDLGAALHEHHGKGAIASVVTLEVPNDQVQNYGIVVADNEGKVECVLFEYTRIGAGMELLEMIVSPRYCAGLTREKSPILLR